MVVGFFLLLVGGLSVLAAGKGTIHLESERKLITIADGQGQLALRLNYDGRCVLDQIIVRGREVAAESGVVSGIRQDGRWFTTAAGIASPRVAVGRDTLTVTRIVFGKPDGEIAHETWQFTAEADRIYHNGFVRVPTEISFRNDWPHLVEPFGPLTGGR